MPFEEDDDEDGTGVAGGENSKRDCVTEIFPHSYPRKFWDMVLDALRVETCQVVRNMTTTAHPSFMMAAHGKGLPCHVVCDRTGL